MLFLYLPYMIFAGCVQVMMGELPAAASSALQITEE
jgi:hypothetical protein